MVNWLDGPFRTVFMTQAPLLMESSRQLSLGMEQSKRIQRGLGILPLKFSQFSASDSNKFLHAEPGDIMLW